ncbi:MAG: hypothetical protein RBR97_19725 [Bacteroidales bacterium]|nr:hypothetical protein [Bacteroidales bacterium]
MPVGELVSGRLHCYCKEIDMEDVTIENVDTNNKIDTLHNYWEMKKHGLSRIN